MGETKTTRGMKLLAGNSNRPLADAIALYLKLPLTKAVVRRFADMEIFVEIQENVRGEDIFVIQSTSFPVNDNLMELLIITDALRRASARRITAAVAMAKKPDSRRLATTIIVPSSSVIVSRSIAL